MYPIQINGLVLWVDYLKFYSLRNEQGDVVLLIFHQNEHDMSRSRKPVVQY